MTIRHWVIEKLGKGYIHHLEGTHGFRINQLPPEPFVYCVEPDAVHAFDVDDLEAALAELPGIQFFVVVKRDVTHQAYERADEVGVCIDGLGDLRTALSKGGDISGYQNREQTYIRRRVLSHWSTSDLKRRGKLAYEIGRIDAMRPVTIITIDHYELTADGVHTLLDDYGHLVVDAIVTTNPYGRGFAPQAIEAAGHTDVELLKFDDFLAALSKKWI